MVNLYLCVVYTGGNAASSVTLSLSKVPFAQQWDILGREHLKVYTLCCIIKHKVDRSLAPVSVHREQY